MTTISLVYAHLASNLGDNAVTLGAVHLMREVRPSWKIEFLQPTIGSAGVAALASLQERIDATFTPVDTSLIGRTALDELGSGRHRSTRHLVSHLVERLDDEVRTTGEAVALNSGEHLFSDGSLERDAELLARLLPLFHALERGARVFTLPSTFGPFEGGRAREVFRLFAERCDLVAAREAASARIVEAAAPGIRSPALLDPAFFLPGAAAGRIRGSRRDEVVLAPRLDGFGLRVGLERSRETSKRSRETRSRSSRAFATYDAIGRALLGRRMRVRLVAQSQADLPLCQHLAESLSDATPNTIRAERPETIEDLLGIYRDAGCVVTSRFHSIVFAWHQGRPAIPLPFPEHGHKIPGLLEMLELGEPQRAEEQVDPRLWVREVKRQRRRGAPAARIADLRGATLRTLDNALPRDPP